MNKGNLREIKIRQWTIGSFLSLDPDQVNQVIGLTKKKMTTSARPLEGRGSVQNYFLNNIGEIILKPYLRGGWIRKLVKDRYLNLGKCRAHQELKMLMAALENGIRVPEPVFYLQKGGLLYQCWLGTKQLTHIGSLAQISRLDRQMAELIIPHVWQQIEKLVAIGIHHVDLHPGNILVGAENQSWLIDFDKAYFLKTDQSRLMSAYVNRWNRAVTKHHLPQFLLK